MIRTAASPATAASVGASHSPAAGQSRPVPEMISFSWRLITPTPLGQGHSTRSEPAISPTITAMTGLRALSSSRPSTVENRASPTAAPARNTTASM